MAFGAFMLLNKFNACKHTHTLARDIKMQGVDTLTSNLNDLKLITETSLLNR